MKRYAAISSVSQTQEPWSQGLDFAPPYPFAMLTKHVHPT